MYFKDDPTRIQNVGARICFRQNVHAPIGWQQRDQGQFVQPIEVDMVGSGAMLTRREALRRWGTSTLAILAVNWMIRISV